jgi:hypothetical protein
MVTHLIDKTRNELEGYHRDPLLETYYRVDSKYNGFNTNSYSSIEDAYTETITEPRVIIKGFNDDISHNKIVEVKKMCITALDDTSRSNFSKENVYLYLYEIPLLQTIIQRKEKFLYLTEAKFVHTAPINPELFNFVKDLNDNDISDLIEILPRLRGMLSLTIPNDDTARQDTTGCCFQDAKLTFKKPKHTRLYKVVEPSFEKSENSNLHSFTKEEKPDHDIIIMIDRELKQRNLTLEYARLFKDDNTQTMASVVVNNVMKYLSKHIKEEHIKKNMISKDLIISGIKKMRRANGYVYGIEDTSDEQIANC